ncbi:MAG TPA: membrane protein insertase YidC [Verrucomicrobiae bacterium]
MDKTGIIVVSICVLLLGWWFFEQNKIAQQVAQQRAQFDATNRVATTQTLASNGAAVMTTISTEPAPVVVFDTNAPEQTLVLTNGRARYTFTSRGGGLKLVELLDYPETVSARWKNSITNSASVAALNARATVPVLAVLGGESLIGDGNFALTKTASGVRMEKSLPDGLRLTKNFQFGSNFLITADVRIENTSDKPLNLPAQELVVGTATPMDVDDNGQVEGAMWFDGTAAQDQPLAAFAGGGFGCTRGTPKTEIRAGVGNVIWAAAHNQFFALMAMTRTNEPAQQMVARSVTLPIFQNVGVTANLVAPKGIQTALVYPAMTLSANSAVDRTIILFAGPKEYRTLAQVGEQLNNHADQVMNFGTGFAGFWGIGSFFAKLLLSAMNGLHDLTGLGYGWIIVLITILIKLLFWPLTAKSTRSMKRMQALAPKLVELKEKYKDDVQKLTAKQWELYKENKVNPMSGCLPMVIQMPVFIGFFTMIRSAIELRGATFLWATDLSKPDTLFMIPGLDLPFNLLPILMGGAMLWQSHLQPASPGMDPAQQKMMRWMPAIFILFLYGYPSGLALYWTVNNLLTILQTKMTKTIGAASLPVVTTNPALTPAPKKKK